MVDISSELRGETIRAAFLALVGGVSAASAVIGWLIRRDISRTDTESTERALKVTALEEKLDRHVATSGYEIQDIHLRVCVLAAQIRHTVPEVEIPEWPSRQ